MKFERIQRNRWRLRSTLLPFAITALVVGWPCGEVDAQEGGGARSVISEREALMEDKFDVSVRSGSTGARLSSTRLQGSDADNTGTGMGLTFSGHAQRYAGIREASLREESFSFIGGGSLGFEGGIGIDIAMGLRIPFAETHGPVVRLGMRGYLLGNKKLYESLLEIPQLQLGYQRLERKWVWEVAGRAGPVLAGRFNTGDETERKLGRAFEVGGHAGLHANPIHLQIKHTRVLLGGPLGDVDIFSSRLCGDAGLLQFCVDTRIGHGGAVVRGGDPLPDPVTSYFGGFSIGILDRAFRMAMRAEHRPVIPPESTKKDDSTMILAD